MNEKLNKKQTVLVIFFAIFITALFGVFSEFVSSNDEQEFYALEHGERLTQEYSEGKLH